MYCKIEEPSVLCIVEYEQSKGQLISKGPFGILNSSKKRTKKINPTTYYDTSGLIVFAPFFGRIEDTKKTFRN